MEAAAIRRPTFFWVVMAALAYPYLRFPCRMKLYGRERLPREGGFVLAANHLSNFDPWVVAYPYHARRQLRYMAKAELFRGPLVPLLRAAGAYPVRRGAADAEAFRASVRLARRGEIVVMFPTGTKEKTARRRGIELRPHTGAARVALAAGVPIVPVAIKGTDRLARFGPVRMSVGTPDTLDDLRGLPARAAAQAATDRMMQAIAELRAELD